jgi:hypothetical protein
MISTSYLIDFLPAKRPDLIYRKELMSLPDVESTKERKEIMTM